MTVIGIVVCCVHIIIILAVPSDIDQRVLQLANIFVGISIAFSLALSVAGFLQLFDLEEVLCILQMLVDGVE